LEEEGARAGLALELQARVTQVVGQPLVDAEALLGQLDRGRGDGLEREPPELLVEVEEAARAARDADAEAGDERALGHELPALVEEHRGAEARRRGLAEVEEQRLDARIVRDPHGEASPAEVARLRVDDGERE